jgi:hypothetical protein
MLVLRAFDIGRRELILDSRFCNCIIAEEEPTHQCHPSWGERDKCHPRFLDLAYKWAEERNKPRAKAGRNPAFFLVTNSEQAQEIHTTRKDAGSATRCTANPRFYVPGKVSRVFGIRNNRRALIFFAQFSIKTTPAFGMIPQL